jgi:hypothetical protein
MTHDMNEGVKIVGDGISLITVVGTLAQVLPAIAALFTIIWTGFRIYETKTVQSWLNKTKKD